MKTKLKTLLAIGLFATGMAITAAQAASNSMRTTGWTRQPIGHHLFCKQHPQECAIKSSSTKAEKLTRKRWADMVEVNSYSNNSVEPVTDQEHYGVEEHWTYPKSYGDCEDYVLLKRYLLMQRGWKPSDLLVTVVKQSNGDGHAVLTVRTDRGDFILDNLESDIKLWTKTGYRYLKRQSVKHTGKWSGISDKRKKVANY